MYQYTWDPETGGLLLTSEQSKFSKEPRPVYYRELDILGFDRYWSYPKDDSAPIMWAEANNYIYRGRTVAKTRGGSLYTAPEIILLDEPEANGGMLRFVDVEGMVQKNHALMETLVQTTVKSVYNTYLKYKDKIDVFYVAFSGGKDSIIALDIAQRTLPHDQFKVLFGDTQMEFPDTYKTVERYKKACQKNGIDFVHAVSNHDVIKSWIQFGPPATTCRWCCSVHKTTPQILALRNVIGKRNFTGMAIVGVRGDESIVRSEYENISIGKKHQGQYNYNAILEWNSAEVYLYIYENGLYLNPAYKKGNRRVGCLLCPRAAERSEYFAQVNYPKEMQRFLDVLCNSYSETFNKERLHEFIQRGGWKARKSARDISGIEKYWDEINAGKLILHIRQPNNSWKEWIKTLGHLVEDGEEYTINYAQSVYTFNVENKKDGYDVIIDERLVKNDLQFAKAFKNVFRKAAYCINCQECEANCHNGCITIEQGIITVSDKCIHCLKCHQIELGCLVAASRKIPKGDRKMIKGSLNRYSHHAPKLSWFEEFFQYKDELQNKSVHLGSKMIQYFKMFLRDVGLICDGTYSDFAKVIEAIGLQSEMSWALMLSNGVYTPQLNWFINKYGFYTGITKKHLIFDAIEAGTSEAPAKDVWASLARLAETPFKDVGLGSINTNDKKNPEIMRTEWKLPDARVILYSLYKFAEACGEYYQFTLETLLDDSIERDGVSPTRIFGLNREAMIRLLNGLAVNYPEFISVSFTLDLDTITLRSDKTSQDVLKLF